MKIKFLGSGGAFASIKAGNSNMVLTSDSGKKLMVDFGTTAPYVYRDEFGEDFNDIDAVYISHQHADHIGGLEFLAFWRYFCGKKDENNNPIRPKLYTMKGLMKELWDYSLRGGLESVQGKIMTLTDYFDCKPINENGFFVWEGYVFTPVQTLHVRSGYIIKNSYGLLIRKAEYIEGKVVFLRGIHGEGPQEDIYITTDTQYDEGLIPYYKRSKLIFHDCETSKFKSIVHPNYNDLKGLPEDIKAKMWLYHYSDDKFGDLDKDGFRGFVRKGDEFTF